MKATEFCNLYSETNDSERVSLIKKHITTSYLPYEQKMMLCKRVIDAADYTPKVDIVDKTYYSPNTPLRFLLFCVGIVSSYTDIEYEYLEDGTPNVIKTFNLLDEKNIFEGLFNELGREYKVLQTILNMMVEDTNNKENNIVGFLTTKIDSLETLYNAAMPIIEDKIVNFPDKEN